MNHLNNSNEFKNCLKLAQNKIYTKYSRNLYNKFNKLIINTILRNGKCHIVALFKDFLLYYDYAEFLKRYYKNYELRTKLLKILHYFKDTFIFYPNYTPLIESKYIYNNIIKKQMVINKIEKNKKDKLKIRYKAKYKEDIKENDEKKFFDSTIYNDILNESKSFMSFLFGVEGKNNEKKIKDYIENEKEIEDFIKIIDNVQNNSIKSEVQNLMIKHKASNKGKNYKKPFIDNLPLSASTRFIQKKTYIYNYIDNSKNNSNSLFIKSGNNSNIKKIKNQKYIKNNNKINKTTNFIDSSENKKQMNNININNNSNASKDNINIDKLDSSGKPPEKIVYHRKVKSTLIGNYLNKVDLPSNLNVINSLKLANEAFAENQNRTNKISLYKKMKNSHNKDNNKEYNKENKDSKNINTDNNLDNNKDNNLQNIIIKIPKKVFTHISSAKNIKNNKTFIMNSPKGKEKENIIIKLTKVKQSTKKIDIPRISKKPLCYFVQKRNSPINNRNFISGISLNKSNGEANNTLPTNYFINSNVKPENGRKSVNINSNMTGPYSKPKGLYKEKKYIGISPKRLFNNSYLNNIKEELEGKK